MVLLALWPTGVFGAAIGDAPAPLSVATEKSSSPREFTVWSKPLDLRYGEVFNQRQLPLPLPREVVSRYADGTTAMAVFEVAMEMVRVLPDGSHAKVPPTQLYVHDSHVDLLAPDGTASVSFDASMSVPRPFGKMVRSPALWAPFLHVVNMRRPGAEAQRTNGSSALAQCPCTPQRLIDSSAGTIDGQRPTAPLQCPQWLAANPACSLSTYVGGVRCCAHGVFLLDTSSHCATPHCAELPAERFALRATFRFEDESPKLRHLDSLACCDLPTDVYGRSNAEFDVPPCDTGTPAASCVYRLSSPPRSLDLTADEVDQPRTPARQQFVELVHARPRVREGAIEIELQDALTNHTLCSASVADGGLVYGSGDEAGYLTHVRACTWTDHRAPRLSRQHPMRTVVTYDARTYTAGARASFTLSGHYVGGAPTRLAEGSAHRPDGTAALATPKGSMSLFSRASHAFSLRPLRQMHVAHAARLGLTQSDNHSTTSGVSTSSELPLLTEPPSLALGRIIADLPKPHGAALTSSSASPDDQHTLVADGQASTQQADGPGRVRARGGGRREREPHDDDFDFDIDTTAQWSGTCPSMPPTPPTPPRPPLAPPPERAIREFRMNYHIGNETYELVGHEPTDGDGFPVYMHAGGAGDKLENPDEPYSAPELTFTREMARRGYVAAISELPERFQMACDQLLNNSRYIFGYGGADDTTSTSAIATLCRRPGADCSNGIALHGLSVAGMLAGVAPRFAPVTGLLSWSNGIYVPHGHSCCGNFGHSGEPDYSCCPEDGGLIGGSRLECLTAEAQAPYLAPNRRRLTLGQGDPLYSEYTCPERTSQECQDVNDGVTNMTHCTCDHERVDSAINQCRAVSGYDCGDTYDCIQPDGSGYYVATVAQVGGDTTHILQAHNFHLIAGRAAPGQPPQYTEHYAINPRFEQTSEAWGLIPQLEWLAETARQP